MDNVDKRKPVSLTELLLFEKFIGPNVKLKNRVFLRNKIEYFLDSIPPDKDRKPGVVGEAGLRTKEQKLQIGLQVGTSTRQH